MPHSINAAMMAATLRCVRPGAFILAWLATGLIVGAVAALWPDWGLRALPVAGVLAGLVLLHRRMHFGPLSPVAILVICYLALAILGPLAADQIASGAGVSARIVLSPSAEEGAFFVLVIAAAAAQGGAWLYSLINRTTRKGLKSQPTAQAPSHMVIVAAGVAGTIPLGLQVAAFGPGLLFRLDYLGGRDAGEPIVVAAQTLALPAIAVLGWLTQVSATRVGKVVAALVLSGYVLTLFSLGTRAFALIPLMAALGIIAGRPNSKRMVAMLAAAGLASVLLLQVPLTLRASATHGLLPYINTLAQTSAIDLTSSASNVLFAYQLTGQVAFSSAPLSFGTLLVSLDPRPGATTDWYNIAPLLRVNDYTPFNAIGELGNYGWPVLAGFFVLVGAYFGRLEWRLRELLESGQGLAALLLFALACLFVVLTFEYNLRSCVRILYYIIAADIAVALVDRVAGGLVQRPREPVLSSARGIARSPRVAQ
jgi:hypothetical protein